ncbi:hypothetical protein TNCV_4177801 [Trichonephila clavipes]|nr:hypothetical protein TNCV_4177801 [Trichonephila clavipes]
MGIAVSRLGESTMRLVVVQTFTSSTQVQLTGPAIVTRFFSSICASFRGAMGLQLLHGRNKPHTISSHSSCRTALESEDIERMIGRHDLGSQSHEHVWDF